MEEFQNACGSDDTAAVRTLFDLLDEDKSNSIEKKELVHALRHNEEAAELAKKFPRLKAMFDAEQAKREERRKKKRRSTMQPEQHAALAAAREATEGNEDLDNLIDGVVEEV